jgi:hypothetical protein
VKLPTYDQIGRRSAGRFTDRNPGASEDHREQHFSSLQQPSERALGVAIRQGQAAGEVARSGQVGNGRSSLRDELLSPTAFYFLDVPHHREIVLSAPPELPLGRRIESRRHGIFLPNGRPNCQSTSVSFLFRSRELSVAFRWVTKLSATCYRNDRFASGEPRSRVRKCVLISSHCSPPSLGTGGALLFQEVAVAAPALVLIDYQNVHKTAWECFTAYGVPVYEALIDPVKFADQAALKWQSDTGEELSVISVLVYRGLPDPRRERNLNSRVSRQNASWGRDPRVVVHTRPLRYPRDWPDEKAQEKGVDVMLALALVRAALDRKHDRIIVATRDTDLLPAVEMAELEQPGSVILANWDGQSTLKTVVPSVTLGRNEYNRSRDTRNYS